MKPSSRTAVRRRSDLLPAAGWTDSPRWRQVYLLGCAAQVPTLRAFPVGSCRRDPRGGRGEVAWATGEGVRAAKASWRDPRTCAPGQSYAPESEAQAQSRSIRLRPHGRDDELLQETPPISPSATRRGRHDDDEVLVRDAEDVLSSEPDSRECQDTAYVAQPPLISVARCVWRHGVLDPLLRDDLLANPPTFVEIEVAEPSHVPGCEDESPAADAVPLGVPGPLYGAVAEHIGLAVGVSHVGGRSIDSKGANRCSAANSWAHRPVLRVMIADSR